MNNGNKIRILYLITDLGKGGAERFLIDLCTALAAHHDFEFIIATLLDNNQYKSHTGKFHITHLNYKTFSLLGSNENTELRKLINDFDPHIIHTHRFLAEFITSYYPKDKIKYICHCHDNMEQFINFSFSTLFNPERILQFIEKQYLVRNKYNKTTTYFIANSTHTRKFFINSLPSKCEKNVRLMYYGFNFTKFYDASRRFIEPAKPVKIINVGSFQKKKNQIFCLAVAHALRKKNIHFEMDLIGSGECFNAVQSAVQTGGLENHVFLRGTVDAVEEWYKRCHIYLHTALYEPFGLVFLEAMAAGLPVVTLDGKGNRDLIEEGKNGFMVEKEDPVIIAGLIERLVNDPQLYSGMSEYAKIYASHYDAGIKINEIIEFYRSLAK